MAVSADMRRYERYPFVAPLEVSWRDTGGMKRAEGVSVEVSERGMGLELSDGIPPGTAVAIRCGQFEVFGEAEVAHSTWVNDKWRVGIRLTRPLTWKMITPTR